MLFQKKCLPSWIRTHEEEFILTTTLWQKQKGTFIFCMMALKKEPVIFPYMCRYRLNRHCETQKTSLSPRCISLLSERSSDTILPSSNFGYNSRFQPSMEQLLLTTTETNVSILIYLLLIQNFCCLRLFSHPSPF